MFCKLIKLFMQANDPEIAISRNGVPIRLPDERWNHIIERHDVLADKKALVLETLSNPSRILAGNVRCINGNPRI